MTDLKDVLKGVPPSIKLTVKTFETKKSTTYKPDNRLKPVKCKGCGCKVAPWNTYCAECLCEEDCAP